DAVNIAIHRLVEIITQLENSFGLVDHDALERDLTAIEDALLKGIEDSVSDSKFEAINAEGKAHLKSYKQTMPKEIYEKTLTNYVVKKLRELYGIPRLSLFYMG